MNSSGDNSSTPAGHKPSAEETFLRRIIWPWIKANPVPAFTVLGVLLYGVQRLGADEFYGSMGFTPDDVGFTYVTGVSQAAFGVLAVTMIYALLVYPLGWLAGFFSLIHKRVAVDRSSPGR